MTKILDWDDTLLDYLRSSNEDEQIVSFVTSTVLPLLSDSRHGIDWLEIGPGPGTKTLPIARSIEHAFNQKLRRLRLLEPAENWRALLRRNCPHLLQIGELSEVTFEEYVRCDLECNENQKPDFITCFHVLYEPALIREFFLYLNKQKQTGRRLIACVIVEAEKSAFFQLRQQLSFITQIRPALSALEIRRLASQFALQTNEFEVNGQSCKVQDSRASENWLLPFLLGCSRSGLNSFPERVKLEGQRLISEFLSDQDNGILQVPDIAFVITI